MVWSHNDSWMVTADQTGYVKYWQSNMNNVKMFQAHKEPVRAIRCDIILIPYLKNSNSKSTHGKHCQLYSTRQMINLIKLLLLVHFVFDLNTVKLFLDFIRSCQIPLNITTIKLVDVSTSDLLQLLFQYHWFVTPVDASEVVKR